MCPRDLARKASDGQIPELKDLRTMEDEAIIESLDVVE